MHSTDIMREVQKMYDSAGSYFSKTRKKTYGEESHNWPITQEYLDRVEKDQHVLDVGCGDGRLVSGLPKGVDYTGFDFSKTLLSEARKSYPDYEFLYGDVTDPDVWKKLKKYDQVFCVAVLHHLPEKETQIEVLKYMLEHTKKGGMLFITTWNLWQTRMLKKGIETEKLESGDVVNMDFDNTPGRYVVAMDLPYLVEILTEAGWNVDEVFYAGGDGERSDLLHGQNLVAVAHA